MKKIALTIVFIFAAVFVYITVTKDKHSVDDIKEAASSTTAIEKERIIKFWEIYRKATDYRLNDEWQLAAENYRKALKLNDRHEDGLYYLGNMYLELSEYKEAEKCWEKLVEINPRNSRGFRQLANIYLISDELFDIGKAETACREALKLNKEETGPMLSLGEVMLIKGRMDEAAADFSSVTGSNFKSIEAYFLGGYVAWRKGRILEARELFGQAVKYSQPHDHKAAKVIGEGDTKPGKGFGHVTSKSIFRNYMTELPGIQPEQLDSSLEKAYRKLDAQLTKLKSKVL